MVTKKSAAPAAEEKPTEPGTPPEVVPDADEVNRWEFVNRIPTRDEVMALLKSLPAWWGLRPEDFIDYVQPLPQQKKLEIKQPTPSGGTVKVATYVEVFSLYFSVSGRQAMMRAAQEKWGWQVEYTPVIATPTGVGGYLRFDDRLVYRVEVAIRAPRLRLSEEGAEESSARSCGWLFETGQTGLQYDLLGRRHGTAWVPAEGGKAAAGSSPYEKVETSALGRALGAWGFGVLPGSGLASLEEMLGIQQNRAALEGERVIGAGTGPAPDKQDQTPEGLRDRIMQLNEQIAQKTNVPDTQTFTRLAVYCHANLQVDVVAERDDEGNPTSLDLTRLNHGKLLLVRDKMAARLRAIVDAATEES